MTRDAGRVALHEMGSRSLGAVARQRSGTVKVDPGSIAANSRDSVSVTIPGVIPGDIVHLEPSDSLEAGLIFSHCKVTARDTVKVYLANVTASAVDGAELDWEYTLSRGRAS